MADDTHQAAAFHDLTKYYSLSDAEPGDERIGIGDPAVRTAAIWQKDWDIKPFLYKVYETPPPIDLTRDLPDTGPPALEAIAATGAEDSHVVPDRALLGRLGLLTNGSLDRTWTTPDGRVHQYRTAGGTGAQYHLELYFVCTDLADLDAGVYHYSALDHSLRLLRAGDFRGALVEATGNEPSIAAAPVVMAMTSTFWRNAWRYRERAYRHAFWDAGTSLSHILAVAASAHVGTSLVFSYADAAVAELLGIDGRRESAVALVALGRTGTAPPPAPGFGPLDLPTRRLSPAEVTFHAITDMHLASTLRSVEEAAQWRSRRWHRPASLPTGELTELRPLPVDQLDPRPAEQIIFRRRSTRNYDTDVEIPFEAFSTLLQRSTRGVASDVLTPGAPLTDLYLIVNAVQGLAPGVYLHHPARNAVELVRAGTFREQATRIAANQKYAGDAHVNLYYLAHLPSILDRYGDRGYRLAQLEGALHAGKLHLGTHALGLGAVGSTSFDDEVIDFFSPHAAGKDYMFVTVFGKRRRKG
ncbi:SagB-type dehydrogenase family enzyme [Pseudonocardia hierapolitana]|uniref:SagB-type dehydrogenase family enzyme n=1 Tax=Pseudonocardia hierapolitana TaxID=1128676 RepID=A0A561T0G1_9PSEU|nr:SagB/ThcOx family dehydrogenase [Pseudonocardia hierapolitana]TWF80616.1 SagB-type dehydrogenase family enzyme [Pseudonocardia hierapolitana]